MTTRLLLTVLVVANVATALAVVHARHRHRVLFVEASRLEKARDLVDAVALRPGGLFQLQPAEIDVEFVARDRLGMKFPEGAEIVVIRP